MRRSAVLNTRHSVRSAFALVGSGVPERAGCAAPSTVAETSAIDCTYLRSVVVISDSSRASLASCTQSYPSQPLLHPSSSQVALIHRLGTKSVTVHFPSTSPQCVHTPPPAARSYPSQPLLHPKSSCTGSGQSLSPFPSTSPQCLHAPPPAPKLTSFARWRPRRLPSQPSPHPSPGRAHTPAGDKVSSS